MWRTRNALLDALEFAYSHQRRLKMQGEDGNGFDEPKATEEELRMAHELIMSIHAAIRSTKAIDRYDEVLRAQELEREMVAVKVGVVSR